MALAYRPDGLRYSKTVGGGSAAATHIHLWDGQNIVAEVGATGALNTRYIRGTGLIAREVDGALQYYLFDAHGDVLHRLDANGNMLKTYRYDAFGNEIDPEPLDTNPFRYCGEYFDREIGTYYLRARNYDPRIGRFTTEDALRSATVSLPGDRKAVDPLSLNLYTYCHNNPVRYSDPTGIKSDPWEEEASASWELGAPINGWDDVPSLSDESVIARWLWHEDPSIKGQYAIAWLLKNNTESSGISAREFILGYNMKKGAPWVSNEEDFFRPFDFMAENETWDSGWIDAGGRRTYESWLNAVSLAHAVSINDLGKNNPFTNIANDPTMVFYYGGASSVDPGLYNIQIGNSRFIGN